MWWGYVCLLCDYVGLMAALTLDWPRHAVSLGSTPSAPLDLGPIDGWQFEAMEWQFVFVSSPRPSGVGVVSTQNT